jgi:hypothetical protein
MSVPDSWTPCDGACKPWSGSRGYEAVDVFQERITVGTRASHTEACVFMACSPACV